MVVHTLNYSSTAVGGNITLHSKGRIAESTAVQPHALSKTEYTMNRLLDRNARFIFLHFTRREEEGNSCTAVEVARPSIHARAGAASFRSSPVCNSKLCVVLNTFFWTSTPIPALAAINHFIKRVSMCETASSRTVGSYTVASTRNRRLNGSQNRNLKVGAAQAVQHHRPTSSLNI